MHLVRERTRKKRRKKKSTLGQFVLVLSSFCVLLILAFSSFELPSCNFANLSNYLTGKAIYLVSMMPDSWQVYLNPHFPEFFGSTPSYTKASYVALAPAAIVLGYILGPALASLTTGLFLLSGLLGPFFGFFPFAHGGGFDYYIEPGFGYLVGMVVAAWLSARISMNRRTSMSQILCVFAGILTVHVVGVAYLFGAYLFVYLVEGSKTYLAWQPWIFDYVRNLTGNALPYDILFALAAVGVSAPLRWLTRVLCVPNNSRKKSSPGVQRELSYDHMMEEIGVS